MELNRHYIPLRHPNAHPAETPHEVYDEETSREALNASKSIIEYVRRVILDEE